MERFYSKRASELIAEIMSMGLSTGWLCYRLGLHENAVKRIYRYERKVSMEELTLLEEYCEVLRQLPKIRAPQVRQKIPERARYKTGMRKDDFRLERVVRPIRLHPYVDFVSGLTWDGHGRRPNWFKLDKADLYLKKGRKHTPLVLRLLEATDSED